MHFGTVFELLKSAYSLGEKVKELMILFYP